MKANSQLKQQDFTETLAESPDPFKAAAPVGTQACDAARSQMNIAQWSSYLPEECIATMISMGWDVST